MGKTRKAMASALLNTLGKKIASLKSDRKMTSDDLCERTDYGYTTIRQIETGQGLPSLEGFVLICNTLEVDANLLLAEHLTVENLKYNFSGQEAELIEKFRMLTPRERKLVMRFLSTLREE